MYVFEIIMICLSDESEEEAPPPKKEYIFKNKKEAIEAFKALLKERYLF